MKIVDSSIRGNRYQLDISTIIVIVGKKTGATPFEQLSIKLVAIIQICSRGETNPEPR